MRKDWITEQISSFNEAVIHSGLDYTFICNTVRTKHLVKSACHQKPPLPNYREAAAPCLPPAAAIVHFTVCGAQQRAPTASNGDVIETNSFSKKLTRTSPRRRAEVWTTVCPARRLRGCCCSVRSCVRRGVCCRVRATV